MQVIQVDFVNKKRRGRVLSDGDLARLRRYPYVIQELYDICDYVTCGDKEQMAKIEKKINEITDLLEETL